MLNEILRLKDTAWLASRLGLSISTIERLRISDSLDIPPHFTIGRSIRYDEQMVELWLARKLQSNSSKEMCHCL
jgi:predicted DNA-binding transcriptional regulator AlpA